MDKIKFGFYILKEHLYKPGHQEENGMFRVISPKGRVSQRMWYRNAKMIQSLAGGIIVLNDKNIWL